MPNRALRRATAALALACAAAAAEPPPAPGSGGLRLGELADADISYGCGCSFSYPRARREDGALLLHWELDSPAVMRLNGRLLRLRLEQEQAQPQVEGQTTLGDAMFWRLRGDGVEVHAEGVTAWICPPEAESCEVTHYEASLQIRSGAEQITVPVWGSCGC